MAGSPPRVVIIGGGFGGLTAAQSLAKAPVQITLVDRRNHHLFQPLLYQVATAGLNPSDIASPIRRILRHQRNAEVLLAEARSIDLARKTIALDEGSLAYDYLIVATGARHSYFGHDEWAPLAPGLKSIADALEIRRRVLSAFEMAEREPDAGPAPCLADLRHRRRLARPALSWPAPCARSRITPWPRIFGGSIRSRPASSCSKDPTACSPRMCPSCRRRHGAN